MNTNRGRVMSRCGVAVLLGVHLLGAAGLPLADAHLEGPVTAVHVEDAQDGACTPGHNHQTCALCQHLAHADGPAPTAATPRADHGAPMRAPYAVDCLAHLDLLRTSRSRAPPQAPAFS